jgi:NAD(P)-dependent dehydrogenase (short-subunit alcohol dehydrogenase family)
MKIQDKVIVITGGASGLGFATAKYMLENKGARVAIFDVNPESGERALAELASDRAMFASVDVSSPEGVSAAVQQVIDKFGTVNVCINGAALPNAFKLLDKTGAPTALEKFAQVATVNLLGVFNVMSHCVAQMARNEPESGEERGVVINVSSGAAFEGQIGQSAYAATKAAVNGMNVPLARELATVGVRVNSIAPGLFFTKMVAALPENVLASLRDQMESPKRLGNVEEFAHCCAFIIENAYINGETVRLDGAVRARAK